LTKDIKSRTRTRLTDNTWRDACELQQQKLNLILERFSSKSSKSNIAEMIDFAEENY
jgi:hypothetical protein